METIGEVLKRYRQARISLEDFSELVKVPINNLRKLEANDFSGLPEDFYIRSYIKLYARHLDLDYKKMEKLYEDQTIGTNPTRKDSQSIPTVQPKKIIITPKIINVGLLVLAGLILAGYLFFQVSKIFATPYLEISYPSKDLVIKENYIGVSGKVEPESEIFINDKQIFPDQSGAFSLTLDLKNGLNIIKFSATKKYSKENVQYRQILVE